MLRKLLLLFTLLALSGFTLWLFRGKEHPILLGGTVEGVDLHLGSRVGGRIKKIFVREGDRVRASQLLVELEAEDLKAEAKRAEGILAEARARLEKLKRGFRKEEIAERHAAYQRAQADLARILRGPRQESLRAAELKLQEAELLYKKALADAERAKALYSKKMFPAEALEKALTTLQVKKSEKEQASQQLQKLRTTPTPEELAAAKARAAQAEAAWKLALKGYDPQDIAQARAQLVQAEAQKERVEASVRELNIRAPAAGVVETLSVELGDLVSPNTPVITLTQPEKVTIRAYLPEPYLAWLKLPMPCAVSLDASPRKFFPATIKAKAYRTPPLGEFPLP